MSDRLEEIELNLKLTHDYTPSDSLCLQLSQFPDALKQIQSYIDTKIIEARIDELQQLAQEIGPARDKESWEDWAWRTHKAMADRIKALNHRKENT